MLAGDGTTVVNELLELYELTEEIVSKEVS